MKEGGKKLELESFTKSPKCPKCGYTDEIKWRHITVREIKFSLQLQVLVQPKDLKLDVELISIGRELVRKDIGDPLDYIKPASILKRLSSLEDSLEFMSLKCVRCLYRWRMECKGTQKEIVKGKDHTPKKQHQKSRPRSKKVAKAKRGKQKT